MKYYRKVKVNLVFCSLLLLIIVVGICSYFSPTTFSDFNEVESVWSGEIATSFAGGNGTEENPYQISRGEELAYLKYLIESDDSYLYFDKYYVLTTDINMGNLNLESISFFSGFLDGQGYTISNLNIEEVVSDDGNCYIGLFTQLDGATIENINLNNITAIIDEENDLYGGILAGEIFSSTVNDISIRNSSIIVTSNIGKEKIYIGGISGISDDSTITNTYLNVAIDYQTDSMSAYVGSIVGYTESTASFNNILVVSNIENYLNGATEYQSIYNADNVLDSFLDVLNEQTKNEEYYWTDEEGLYYLKRDEVEIVPKESIIAENAKAKATITLHDSGIDGNVVYINDLESDYNYYMGLNYTSSSDSELPSMENKEIYDDTNLVRVQITYSGESTQNGETVTGTVSLTEEQDSYIYYKMYPVNDNGTTDTSDDYIEIELIDGPFTNRPSGYGFNGWYTDYYGAEISLDTTIYVRYATVPVTYADGKPDDIVIDFTARWTLATVAEVTSNSSSGLTTAISSLKSSGMQQLETQIEKEVEVLEYRYNMSNYYVQQIVSKNSAYPSNSYDASGKALSGRCSSTSTTCTVYVNQDGTTYDPDTTYYALINGTMTETVVEEEAYYTTTTQMVDVFNSTDNMSSYFEQVTIARYKSVVGYYDVSGVYQTSGTCNTSSGCTYYKLIQYYDENGVANTYDSNKTYYYLVTRDTNIMVLKVNLSSGWTTKQTTPLTFTGLYDGTLNNYTWTVSSTYVAANADLVIENMNINSKKNPAYVSSPDSSSNTSQYFYGNYHNVKIGRGITQTGTYVNFVGAYAGNNSTEGSSTNITSYRFIVESGSYSILSLTGGSNSGKTVYVEGTAIYGSDYDRSLNNNDNLDIYFCASGTWGNKVYQNNKSYTLTALHTIVKSGEFGSARPTTTSNSGYSYGIYVGGRGSSSGALYAPHEIIVEGGWIQNIIGGPFPSSSLSNYTLTYIYMKGGEADAIFGGAGLTTTYCNRIIQITGGTVNYSVFGGSNGVSGGKDEGSLSGTPYIYIGGNAIIGNESNITDNSTLWGAEAGSIFGIGNGNTSYDTIGNATNSYIIVDGDAKILRNVYGGGNYGSVGNSGSTTKSEIRILGGTIEGSVFGGGNRNGSGSTSITASVDINIYDGTVLGSIYGGANEKGTIYGSVTINALGGTVFGNIYGGGYGGYLSSSSSGTFVKNDIIINIGDTSDSIIPTIEGSVYGGSAFGTVNGTASSTSLSSSGIEVNVNEGVIKEAVYGGAEGNSTYTPYVLGNIVITINGGNIADVYGGDNLAGTPNGSITIYLNDGTIGRVFGGGNQASVNTNMIYLQGATCTNIFGGSNQAGTVTISNIITTSGTVVNIYGGNNEDGNTITSNVTVDGGTITTAVYGGGKLATTTTTNVILNSATIPSVYGGGENADVISATNVNLNGSAVTNLFGGSNAGGDVAKSNVQINSGSAVSVFGGNNEDGVTTITNIDMINGTVTNMYGGGNKVGVTTSNINLINGKITNLFGGSNESGDVTTTNIKTATTTSSEPNGDELTIGDLYGGNNLGGKTTDTNIILDKGTYDNIYGGGNQAVTEGNSLIYVSALEVSESIYGGGNQAEILGNTNVNVSGETIVGKNVFGGGNHGAVGSSSSDDSTSMVNIAGSKISGNVYGGCNTSVVYGTTKVNIGMSAIDDDALEIADIEIDGTIFGGGEANESGSDDYDFSFISVTKGIDILIDGTGYEDNDLEFVMSGSIFGSGNASSSAGTSTIYVRKLGTRSKPNTSISIQRADLVTIDNSAIELTGTTDRTNEYSSIKYSLNRIVELKIKNDATLLLRENANMLQSFYSLVDIDGEEVKAEVVIDDDAKTVNKNVDNRLYMLAGKNLNVTTNEAATSYGIVSGMTFLGMYQKYSSGAYVYGMYADDMGYGSTATAGDVITGGSYVLGLHSLDHDITVDGYYTNYIDDDYTVLTTSYVNPTPPDSNYYMWTIGTASINYSFNLTASKYSSLGTYELSMKDFSSGNTTFNVIGFNADGLETGVTIKDSTEVPKLASSTEEANSIIGLAMKTETSEWTTHSTTKFYKDDTSSYSGNLTYTTDNQTVAPSLMFYLYHAKNISSDQELGTVVITLQSLVPKNEIEYDVQLVTITITIDTKYYDDADAYDASITYGKKYEMPSATNVNITNQSQFTTYFALFAEAEDEDYYGKNNEYYHALVSSYVLPIGTEITMIDYGVDDTNPNYYYFIVDEDNYKEKLTQFTSDNEVTYYLSDFIKMDSIDSNNTYDDASNNIIYYHDDVNYVMEEFIFIFDFKDTDDVGEQIGNTILLELRNSEDRTVLTVLGIRQNLMIYNLYESSNAVLAETITMDNNYLYYDTTKNISYSTAITYNETELREAIIDTNYESSSMGINVILYDKTGTQVSSTMLSDTTITIDGTTYYVDSNGVFRIKLSDKVSNLTKTLKLDTGTSLPIGTYTMQVILFASNDGLHDSSDKEATVEEVEIIVVGNNNLLVVDMEDTHKLVIGETGLNMDDTNAETFTLTYSSVLENPNIRVAVYKRSTDSSVTNDYIEYDAKDLFTKTFTYPQGSFTKQSTYEYMVSSSPQPTIELTYRLKEDLISGTYKIVFRLYDGNQIIEEDYKYIIIRKNV